MSQLLTLAFSILSGCVGAWWALRVRSEENERAEWKRIEELLQIVHHGQNKGLVAQKMAVTELLTIRRRRMVIIRALGELAEHFGKTEPAGARLASHIVDAIAASGTSVRAAASGLE